MQSPTPRPARLPGARSCLLAAVLSASLFAASTVRADNAWTPAAGGKWESAPDWSLGSPPASGQGDIYLTNTGSKVLTLDGATAAAQPGSLTVETFAVAGDAVSTNVLHLVGAGGEPRLTIEDAVVVGPNGRLQMDAATLRIEGFGSAALSVDGALVLSNGFLNLPGGADALIVGEAEPDASLRAAAGAQVYFTGFETIVGNAAGADRARLTVTGGGTSWSNDADLVLGRDGAGHGEVKVADGARLTDVFALFLGEGAGARGNALVVTGGAYAAALDVLVGFDDTAADNLLRVSGAGSRLETDLVAVDGRTNHVVVDGGGVLAVADESAVGSSGRGNVVRVEGAGSLLSNGVALTVGGAGDENLLDVRAGGKAFTEDFTLGGDPGAGANRLAVTGAGSELQVTGDARIGDYGHDGLAEVTAGGIFSCSVLRIGADGDGNTLRVHGVGSSVRSAGNLIVGDQDGAANEVRVEAGGGLHSSLSRIGYFGGMSNRVVITGTDSVWSNAGSLIVGWEGDGGVLEVGPGGRVATVDLALGFVGGSDRNRVWVHGSGAVVQASGRLRLGVDGGLGRVLVEDGGRLMTTTALVGQATLSISNGIEVVGAGSHWVTTGYVTWGNRGRGHRLLIRDGGAAHLGGLHVAPDGLSVSNRIEVAGGELVVTNAAGNAVLLLERGELVLSNGWVEADGLDFRADSRLRGTGRVRGDLTTAGRVEAGTSVGWLDLEGDLVQSPGASLVFELGGYAPGSGHDRIEVSGGVQFDGSLDVDLLPEFVHLATNGSSFTVLGAAAISGAFDSVPSGSRWTNASRHAVFTVDYGGTNLVLANLELVDTDDDGMSDLYEDTFGLSKTNAADAELDLDKDGQSNLGEAIAGTSAADSNSVLAILSIQPEGSNVRVRWSTAAGRTYGLYASGSVSSGYTDVATGVPGPASGEGQTNRVDAGGLLTGFTNRYYRVRAFR